MAIGHGDEDQSDRAHGDVVRIAVVPETPGHLTALEAVLADLTTVAADLVCNASAVLLLDERP
jgi:hypothetical protein